MREDIAEFFAGRSILLTGGTGFLGKAVLEKLLSDCPRVDRIYLLVRAKRDVDPRQRVEEIVANEVFDPIRIARPDFDKQLVPIPGDLFNPSLGISEEDLETLQENVSVVFHCAASVDFNMMLRSSFELNVLAAGQLLSLAKTFKKLAAYVHVSTAYSQCDVHHIEERFYEPAVKPEALYDLLSSIKDVETINKISAILLKRRPNTYTFTKSLAESVVQQLGRGYPVAVMRPSIIGGIYSGKVRGWTDNLNGATGLYLAVGYGLLRIMPGNSDGNVDIVPVDFCANMLLAIAWNLAGSPISEEPLVYNCTSSRANPITWGRHNVGLTTAVLKNNFCGRPLLRAPSFIMKQNQNELLVRTFLEMKLPVYLADLILFLTRQRPRMRRLYRNLNNAIGAYSFFTTNEWAWDDDNSRRIWAVMSERDRKTFNFDWTVIDWFEYYEFCWLGLKKFARLSSSRTTSTMVGRANNDEKEPSNTKFYMLLFVIFAMMGVLFKAYGVFFSGDRAASSEDGGITERSAFPAAPGLVDHRRVLSN